ncbi:hypothetical protein LVB87_11530 [Lysobacter sp. KIS68-7]|uniref:hypothetical protein n=1 Tax=Lysobacter sp. KIS68-7 TaxID=2904252 RepID=UPI001E3BB8ED|nr:hypothetical protein [Lysobacter sp. KIS68-7]UHQ18812.1 hypothetical protein LVB87_11530 [Lysobacter sp. KIS68-7]
MACEIDWSALAAWVQAIGSVYAASLQAVLSVAAIFAAIWIGERNSREARALVESERRRQADIIASTMELKFHLTNVEITKGMQHLTGLVARIDAGEPVVIPAENLKRFILLDRALGLSVMRPQVTMFDRRTGITVNTALDVLDTVNITVATSIDFYEAKGSKPADLKELALQIIEKLDFAKETFEEARERLELAHDLKPDDDDNDDGPKA